ncbi:MAG: hypothetical protein AAF281_04710 [Pseudomonadota bacterium]
MMTTIKTGKYISIQGEFVRAYPDGSVMVRVGPTYHVGRPVAGRRSAVSTARDTLRAVLKRTPASA